MGIHRKAHDLCRGLCGLGLRHHWGSWNAPPSDKGVTLYFLCDTLFSVLVDDMDLMGTDQITGNLELQSNICRIMSSAMAN